jgi:hypothetical protein
MRRAGHVVSNGDSLDKKKPLPRLARDEAAVAVGSGLGLRDHDTGDLGPGTFPAFTEDVSAPHVRPPAGGESGHGEVGVDVGIQMEPVSLVAGIVVGMLDLDPLFHATAHPAADHSQLLVHDLQNEVRNEGFTNLLRSILKKPIQVKGR